MSEKVPRGGPEPLGSGSSGSSAPKSEVSKTTNPKPVTTGDKDKLSFQQWKERQGKATKKGLTLKERKKAKKDATAAAISTSGKSATPSKGNKRPRSASALATSNLTPENKAPKFTDEGSDASRTDVDKIAKQLSGSTLGPLSQEEENKVGEDALAQTKGEEASKPISYATVASKKSKGVVRYILTADRKPISEEIYKKLTLRVEQALVLEFLASGDAQVKASTLWSSFKDCRGLIAFGDEKSAANYGEQLAKIKLDDYQFRLWSRTELEPLRLLRGPLPEFARTLSKDQLAQLLLRQNNLPGSFKDIREVLPQSKGGNKSRDGKPSLSCSCDEVLWSALNERKFGSKSVMLRLGLDAGSVYTLQTNEKSETTDAVPSDGIQVEEDKAPKT